MENKPENNLQITGTETAEEARADKTIGEGKKTPYNIWKSLRVLVFFMLLLAVIKLVFGILLPNFLFQNKQLQGETSAIQETSEPENKAQTSGEENKPAEPQANNSDNKQELTATESAEAVIETPAEIHPIEVPEATATSPTLPANAQAIDAKAPPAPQHIENTAKTAENEKIAALEARLAKADAEIDELKAQLNAARSAASENAAAGGKFATLAAFNRLRDDVLGGRPYSLSLMEIEEVAGNQKGIMDIVQGIKNDSAYGIVPITVLTTQFPELAKKALSTTENGWVKNTTQKFITIRRVGKQEGTDDEAIIARAESLLSSNDKNLDEKVISELQNLSPPAKEVFAKWLDDAKKWQNTRQDLDNLQILLTKQKVKE